MNIFARVSGWFSGGVTPQYRGNQRTEPSHAAYTGDPYIGADSALQVSTVWACVKLLVETVSSLPLFVYETDNNGNRSVATSQTINTILHDSPNRRSTSQEFWEFMMLNLVLRGNAYAQIQRNSRGDVVALWPLAADQMEVSLLADGSLIYSYRIGEQTLIFLDSDILHVRGMGNGIVGLSPLDHMRSSVNLSIKSQQHTTDIYNKSARRPGVLMTEKVLNPEQRKQIKTALGGLVNGKDSELHTLEAGFKYEPLGMTPADTQLLESRRFSVEELCRWFGVPSVLVNDNSQTTGWGTGVREIVDGFHKLTIRPLVRGIEQSITKRVFTPAQRAAGLVPEFNLDALLRASLKDRMEIYAKGAQNGITTRNESRRIENLPPLEGGDILTAQTNLAPLSQLGLVPQTAQVPEAPIEQ